MDAIPEGCADTSPSTLLICEQCDTVHRRRPLARGEVAQCARCGAEALNTSGARPERKAEKPARTHWDMLLERRSVKELEDILAERLELLRGGEIGPAHLHRANAKKRVS